MTEVRTNPITGESVIVAEVRALRPHDTHRSDATHHEEEWSATCPFCPGHESETPRILVRTPRDQSKPWDALVVANLYPALTNNPPSLTSPSERRLFAARPGFGAHEVIIETPRHNARPADFSLDELARVFTLARDRSATHAENPRIEFVSFFMNLGPMAGASLHHPHSQVVAADFVPEFEVQKTKRAAEYRKSTGHCLVCDVLDAELSASGRVVSANSDFVALCPFFAAQWGETWVVPRAHPGPFVGATAELVRALAASVSQVSKALDSVLDSPDLNWMLETGPLRASRDGSSHWYLRITPRLSIIAGFELGTGILINLLPPERAAAQLRGVIER